VYAGSVNVEYIITTLPDPEFYEESELTKGKTAEEIKKIDIKALTLKLEDSLTTAVRTQSIDFRSRC